MSDYQNPKGGTREPTPKPVPTLGRAPMVTWRQPVGGVRRPSAAAPSSR